MLAYTTPAQSLAAGAASAAISVQAQTWSSVALPATQPLSASFGLQAVTVSPAAPARVAVSPASATVAPFASQAFTAVATDVYGNPVAAGEPT